VRDRIRFLLGHEPREIERIDPTMTVLEYLRRVEHRMGANGESHDTFLEVESGPRRHVGSLRPHARDAQGRNWDVVASDVTKSTGPGGEAEFRRVVDALRDQFDMA